MIYRIDISHDEFRQLQKHKYAELAYTTDVMLDLWNDIVDQIIDNHPDGVL